MLQHFIFVYGYAGLGRMVDIHAHLGTLLAADLIVGEFESGFFPAFYKTKSLLFVFRQIMIGQAKEKDIVGTVLSEFFKF